MSSSPGQTNETRRYACVRHPGHCAERFFEFIDQRERHNGTRLLPQTWLRCLPAARPSGCSIPSDKILHEPIAERNCDRRCGLGEAPEHLDDPLPIRPDLARIAHNVPGAIVARQRTDLGVVVYRLGSCRRITPHAPDSASPSSSSHPCPAAGWKAMHVEIKTAEALASYVCPSERRVRLVREASVRGARHGRPHNPVIVRRQDPAATGQAGGVQRGEHALPMSHLSRVAMCALPQGSAAMGHKEVPIARDRGCLAARRTGWPSGAAGAAYRMHWSAAFHQESGGVGAVKDITHPVCPHVDRETELVANG